jgi:hypothetical protein
MNRDLKAIDSGTELTRLLDAISFDVEVAC